MKNYILEKRTICHQCQNNITNNLSFYPDVRVFIYSTDTYMFFADIPEKLLFDDSILIRNKYGVLAGFFGQPATEYDKNIKNLYKRRYVEYQKKINLMLGFLDNIKISDKDKQILNYYKNNFLLLKFFCWKYADIIKKDSENI